MTDEELQRYLTMPIAEFPDNSSPSSQEYDIDSVWKAYTDLISLLLSKP